MDIKDNKITNISNLLSTIKNRIGKKREMPVDVVDEIKIMGLQSFNQYDKLNPVEVSIQNNEVNVYLNRFSCYKCSLIINNLLFHSSLTNDINVIFVSCNGLYDARNALVNGKKIKALGVVNINQIESWENLKGKKKWVNVTFNDLELEPKSSKHFAFVLNTTNLHNILHFEYSLLDDERKLTEFKKDESKVPVLNFTIQVIQ